MKSDVKYLGSICLSAVGILILTISFDWPPWAFLGLIFVVAAFITLGWSVVVVLEDILLKLDKSS